MTTVYVSGKGYWFNHVFNQDEYRGTKFYKLKFYPEPSSVAAVKAAGKQVKTDEDGDYVTLRRNVLKRWKLKPGENPEFGPPDVMDADGKPWDSNKVIGNGSKVTCKLEVYNSVNGPGSRLEAIRVDEHVEYTAPQENPTEAPPFQGGTTTQSKPFPF